MSEFVVDWTRFEVERKHDIDRDAPYLWVFGVVVDVARVAAVGRADELNQTPGVPAGVDIVPSFVLTRPCLHPNLGQEKFNRGDAVPVPTGLNLRHSGSGVLGIGVGVVAWEKALSSDNTIQQAYDAAVSEMNLFLTNQIRANNLSGASSAEAQAQLRACMEETVRGVFRRRGNLIHDHMIGQQQVMCNVVGQRAVNQNLSWIFETGGTRYSLNGRLTYTA